VAALAIAGLLQAGDRIFGWSSGWLRYMTTVTAMETTTRKFEIDWAHFMICKTEAVGENDKRPLFELAKRLEDDIAKLRIDETDRWVSEFNSSLALLNDLIKSQRESAERTAEAARSAGAEREKRQELGGIELAITHAAQPAAVRIRLDNSDEVTFSGTSWSRLEVSPGLHTVQVTSTTPPAQTIQKVVNVPAGDIGRVEIKLS
jgi:hypothetical protein